MKHYEVYQNQGTGSELQTYYTDTIKPVQTEVNRETHEGNFFSYIVFGVISVIPVMWIYTFLAPYFETLEDFAFAPSVVASIFAYYLAWRILLSGLRMAVIALFYVLESVYHFRKQAVVLVLSCTLILFVVAQFL